MNFCNSVSDWFTNPDSPMYYVVGAIFLLVIIGLLVLFIVLDNKKKKKAAKQAEEKAEAQSQANAETEKSDDNAGETENDNAADKNDGETVDAVMETESTGKSETAEPTESESAPIEQTEQKETEPVEENAIEEKPIDEPVETVETKDETERDVKTEKAEKAEAVKVEKKQTTPKKATVKITQVMPLVAETKKTAPKPKAKPKTFLDALLADKAVHGIYNELKNTVLSYPGMKAKLTKDEETFTFGADKKAAFKLDGDCIDLYLSLKYEDAPKQLGLSKSTDADLPAMMRVNSANIDDAQKSIVFAMNVSLLTRNALHRRVDYIKKAVDAKARAKANAKNKK